MPPFGMISGRIAYLSLDGGEVGRERFDLLEQAGGFVLRAFCEIEDGVLTRDVTLAMDRDWRPRDGFCRITREGHRDSALWFDIDAEQVTLYGRVGEGDPLVATMPLDRPLAYLGLHPLQGDALIVNRRGTDRLGDYLPIDSVTNSISPNGDETVGLRRLSIEVAYLGEETIEVAAGRFPARRYALRWDPSWAAADLWVRRDDCIFLAMRWSHVPTRYELTTLIEG